MTTSQAPQRSTRPPSPLDGLLGSDLRRACAAVPTGAATRILLARRPEIEALRRALREGEVTDIDLERFVAALLRRFRPGTRLPGQAALSGLAVALETRRSPWVERFFEQLAGTSLVELGTASQVARACTARRTRAAQRSGRTFTAPMNGADGPGIRFGAGIAKPNRVSRGVRSKVFELA